MEADIRGTSKIQSLGVMLDFCSLWNSFRPFFLNSKAFSEKRLRYESQCTCAAHRQNCAQSTSRTKRRPGIRPMQVS